ncbi:MAG: SDR family oxidoreductase [Chloroflexaceae bacterium]|nr:SDR family oxidoreductase [Chloroflexaceae bacterium]NJO06557.1 SDR family oxidoreductase [Chloroflexaceae bacterium]
MDRHGRVALVTGGAKRLGRAISLALAGAGATLMIHYNSSADEARATLDDVRQLGVEADLVKGSLHEVATAEAIIDQTVERWGRLDVLICNAGIWGDTPLGTVTPERWDELHSLNVRTPFFMAQRAAPHLRAAGGSVVAIADVGIWQSWKHYTPYLASKAALAMVVQNLANDLAPEVRVNAVAPGPVLLPDDWNDEQTRKAANSTLLKRVGTADDVASAVLFLATADYITGVVLPVDGGQRLKP